MKLTINRSEAREGLIFKATRYYLEVIIEFTDAEKALIKKHNWSKQTLVDSAPINGLDMALPWTIQEFYKPQKFRFLQAGALSVFESELIENAKKLKGGLEAVSDFAGGGPVEVKL